VWTGTQQQQRQEAIGALHRVLGSLPDRSDFLTRWNAKVAATGMDAPLIRKHLGLVALEQGAVREAIGQLELARALQPADASVHEHLLAAFDRLGDEAAAIDALFVALQTSPQDLDLYVQLARRLGKRGDEAGMERAHTSLVEVQPDEAESHRRLAGIREGQDRHADAVVQWRQVVRIRKLEPDGWLDLAQAQIAAGQFDGAAQTIEHVLEFD
jgi:tetratricopeptide (TPR) repeat protein